MSRIPLLAPFAAWAGPLSEVPDDAFAEGLLGEGLALDPLEGVVRAPCDAMVVAVAPTAHSVTLRHESGVELLIHVGVDTVTLGGNGFEVLTAAGAKVRTGDELLRFDLDYVAREAKSLMTPVVLLGDNLQLVDFTSGTAVAAGDLIGTVVVASGSADRPASSADAAIARRSVRITLSNGLHARPCARIAAALKPLEADATIMCGGKQANARSITAMLKLNAGRGDLVSLEARGPGARLAADAIASLLLAAEPAEQIAPVCAAAPPSPELLPTGTDRLLTGIRAAPGGAHGTAVVMKARDLPVPQHRGTPAEERACLTKALAALSLVLRDHARQSDIAEAHLSLLTDPELLSAAHARIDKGASAPAAWRETIRAEIAALEASPNPLFAGRAADLLDLERQLIALLIGGGVPVPDLPENAIVVADELLPSAFLALDSTHLAGVVTAGGGPNSHVAILAASRGVPMLVSCGPRLLAVVDGTPLLIENNRPVVHVDPAPAIVEAFTQESGRLYAQAREQVLAAGKDCFTADGRRIEVFANCGSAEDANLAVQMGAEGCGLLRTEFLFLDRQQAPSKDEQAESYAGIAAAFGERPVIVRTLDAGSDKPLAFLPMAKEENPALGTRGIRLSLARPELLDEQLVAILEGVPQHQRRIMVPMVVDPGELHAVRTLLRTAEERLGITAPTPLGVMIETPASALVAEQLARDADFLSIGSNDLTQYTLAMDRQNPELAALADALHPAVLRLVRLVVEGARAHGRWVGVCGNIASDPEAAALLIGLGVDELSAAPRAVPTIKARIAELQTRKCHDLADLALQQSSAEAVRRVLTQSGGADAL